MITLTGFRILPPTDVRAVPDQIASRRNRKTIDMKQGRRERLREKEPMDLRNAARLIEGKLLVDEEAKDTGIERTDAVDLLADEPATTLTGRTHRLLFPEEE